MIWLIVLQFRSDCIIIFQKRYQAGLSWTQGGGATVRRLKEGLLRRVAHGRLVSPSTTLDGMSDCRLNLV